MARWTDLATWVGPTTARSTGAMANPPRGLVLHIASGYYEGTISWQKRSSGADRTSSHFIVGRDGRCAQMVDTADGSWAQKSGNNTWLSIELEGFASDDGLHASHPGWETATGAQLEVCAKLLARAHRDYGIPLQLATSPSGRGLGHHSMGAESGVDWGHSACPGNAIKAQKPAILARAVAIANGDDMDQNEQVTGLFNRGNRVGDVFADLSNDRDWWYAAPGGKTNNPPPAGSRADLVVKAAQQVAELKSAVAALQMPAPSPVSQDDVSGAVAHALSDPAVVAALVKAINDDAARRAAE